MRSFFRKNRVTKKNETKSSKFPECINVRTLFSTIGMQKKSEIKKVQDMCHFIRGQECNGCQYSRETLTTLRELIKVLENVIQTCDLSRDFYPPPNLR